ncbi:diflavin oxidoreductase [Silvibacterium acidisoli]|uniref:diflavin oxidoreductase n=1 Tax=Acidobacteriaceae bacterium ZG23-2 TaxID=2883246 RepID=UPI00406CC912
MIPRLPEDAPFSPEQRIWLNGLLAELFTGKAALQTEESNRRDVKIYFATQSGTAERLAKMLAKSLKSGGHTAQVSSVETLRAIDLQSARFAVFFASTYGEGEPPETARRFHEELCSARAAALAGLKYAVFGLGDSNYENFCRFGVDLDERLSALGAHRLTSRVECDVDVDGPFDFWQTKLIARLVDDAVDPPEPDEAPAIFTTKKATSLHTRENPFLAELRVRTPLTHDVSSKLTVHLEFDLEDAPINYEVGDSAGIIAQNDPVLVNDILSLVPFDRTEKVTIARVGDVTIEDALLHYFQPTRLTRKMVNAFAAKEQCAPLTHLLPAEQSQHLEDFMWGRGPIDLLQEYPGAITTAAELAAIMPRLTPRLYSISSSPAAHGRILHLTVAIVRYRSHNRERGGVATTMLADRVDVGSRIPVYIQPNKKFRLPEADKPIIMIGPGTGIAPFRAFLHERQALGHKGKNWLFFGERSASTDYLYKDELTTWAKDGHLTQLDTAFSRDQEHKIYVQDRMAENGAEFWKWLDEGAMIYVCGDANRMAKDVHATLHRIVETHGNMSAEAAAEYVTALVKEHRYHRDVY